MRRDKPPRLVAPEIPGDPIPPSAHDTGAFFAEEGFGTVDGFESADDPDGLTVRGWCPRCKGRTSFTFQPSTPGAVRGLLDRLPGRPSKPRTSGPETATVYCACGHPHAGRPGDSPDSGCGAYWKITLP